MHNVWAAAPACSLPSVVVLNGGAVSDGEREDAERFFIRYYQDRPEQEPPERYSHMHADIPHFAPNFEGECVQ